MTHNELFDIFMKNPREKWIELAAPHLVKVSKYECKIPGDMFPDEIYPFSLEVLAPDYSFELNPGDVVKVSKKAIHIGYRAVPGNRWMVIRKPPIDCCQMDFYGDEIDELILDLFIKGTWYAVIKVYNNVIVDNYDSPIDLDLPGIKRVPRNEGEEAIYQKYIANNNLNQLYQDFDYIW